MFAWNCGVKIKRQTFQPTFLFLIRINKITVYFPWCSSDTVNFLRPLARREANTRRPFFVAILSRKPCLFTRLLLCGWNVLFIVLLCFYCYNFTLWGAKVRIFFKTTKNSMKISKNFCAFCMKMLRCAFLSVRCDCFLWLFFHYIVSLWCFVLEKTF